jgi:methyl-accepting chemotaxis protein
MAAVIDRQKRKLKLLLFGFITPVGISLLVVYSVILVPAVNKTIIYYAVGVMFVPALIMILIHDLYLMKKQWEPAEIFLDQGEEGGVTAQEALVAMLEFPYKQPAIGFMVWTIGGCFACLGAAWAGDFRVNLWDLVFMEAGVVAAAAIITIFQFIYWREVLDPIVGQIIHRAPDVLDKEVPVIRVDLKKSLLVILIPLVAFSLAIAEMAGYRQASSAVQNVVGESNLRKMNDAWRKHLSGKDIHSFLMAANRLEADAVDEPFTVYLLQEKEGTYIDLAHDNQNYEDRVPEVGIEIMMGKLAKEPGGSHLFDLFNSEVAVFRTVSIGGEEYTLIFGYPWNNYSNHLFWFKFISLTLLLIVLIVSTLVARALAREISTPVSKLVEFSKEIGEGRIHRDVFFHANDEVGDLALSLREMSGRLGMVLQKIQAAAKSLDQATHSIHQSADSVREGAKMEDQAIEDVSSAMADMDTTIQGIADNVEVLSASAEESSSSIFEMGAAIQKINESVDILNQSINNVSSSINQSTAALDQVADNVDKLSMLSEQTATSINEMDASTREIEQNANDTAQWSESVLSDAQEGVDAVHLVATGMRDISEVAHAAQQVIERLGGKVEKIGKIVQEVEDIANQTNLLALNAAIIAAQAGEHGRGFAVVADEIKQLADRTSGSTREIHQLIRGVQEESREAVDAVVEGTRATEEGVRLVDLASKSLEKIRESTNQATERIQEIAQTTVEQAQSSRQVSRAIEQVAEMVMQISVATQQQTKGGALVIKSTEEMKAASLQVKRNAEEQLQGSKLITKSIENITDMLYSINQSQQEQKQSSSQVMQLMERIRVVTRQSTESAGQLAEVVGALTGEADTLREQMKRFQLLSDKDDNG